MLCFYEGKIMALEVGDTVTIMKNSTGASTFVIEAIKRKREPILHHTKSYRYERVYKLEGLTKWFTAEEIYKITRW